jgi:RHS repeat-associated protein
LYVQQDANWNVTALVDVNGNVLERYVYDPYGAVTVLTPTWTARGTSAYGSIYLFQGERIDPTVGLFNVNGRVYSPTLGRPEQADPLGLRPDPRNYYRWEGDGPTDRTDPSGLAVFGPRHPKGWKPPPPPPPYPYSFFDPNPKNTPGYWILWQLGYHGDPPIVFVPPPVTFGTMSMVGGGLLEGCPRPNPIQGLPRTGSALKTDLYHGFPTAVDGFASFATSTQLESGATLYQLEGSVNGVDGRFEWIVQNGNVTHRMFVPGGTINGVPIQP